MVKTDPVIWTGSESGSVHVTSCKNKKTDPRQNLHSLYAMTAQTMFTIGGLTWSKFLLSTDVDEMRAFADALKNKVFVALPGSALCLLARNGLFFTEEVVQISNTGDEASPNITMLVKAADPGGLGAIIDVNIDSSMLLSLVCISLPEKPKSVPPPAAASRARRASPWPASRTRTAGSAWPCQSGLVRWGGRSSPPSRRNSLSSKPSPDWVPSAGNGRARPPGGSF